MLNTGQLNNVVDEYISRRAQEQSGDSKVLSGTEPDTESPPFELIPSGKAIVSAHQEDQY